MISFEIVSHLIWHEILKKKLIKFVFIAVDDEKNQTNNKNFLFECIFFGIWSLFMFIFQ